MKWLVKGTPNQPTLKLTLGSCFLLWLCIKKLIRTTIIFLSLASAQPTLCPVLQGIPGHGSRQACLQEPSLGGAAPSPTQEGKWSTSRAPQASAVALARLGLALSFLANDL